MQTKGSYDFTLQSYDSYSSYMDFTLKERMSQTVVSFGFSIPGVFEFGFNYNSAKYSKSVKKLRRASGKVSLPPLTSSTSTHSQSELLHASSSPTASSGPRPGWSWPSTC